MRVRAGRFELLGKRVEKRSPPGDERDVIAALRVATSHRRPEPGPHAEDRDHALGITPREWAALSSLDDHPGLSQREMAELLGVDRTTMVALVDTLQSKGLR